MLTPVGKKRCPSRTSWRARRRYGWACDEKNKESPKKTPYTRDGLYLAHSFIPRSLQHGAGACCWDRPGPMLIRWVGPTRHMRIAADPAEESTIAGKKIVYFEKRASGYEFAHIHHGS